MTLDQELEYLSERQLKELSLNCLKEQEKYYNEVASHKLDPHAAFYMMHGGFKAIRERYSLQSHGKQIN